MGTRKMVTGHATQGSTPDWAPLARVMDEDLMAVFMWMFEVELEDGTRLHAYKHIDTRRYMHLDEKGRSFVYCGGESYRRLPLAEALELALGGWQVLHTCPEEVTAAWAALERARRRSKKRRAGGAEGEAPS